MQKLVAYPLSLIYFICFGLSLVVFHPIQWLALNCLGYKAHKTVVDLLQLFLMGSLRLLGTGFRFINPYKISTSQPIIIVSNHQSMYDIPPLIWHFRKHHVKFVSKKELGKGIPSVSFNLRHGGSVLIDRKKPVTSVAALEKFANRISKKNWAAIIFPEGTRSRNGTPKPFKTKGLLTLFEHIPNAIVVPISINNSWKTLRYGKFPMGLGAKITFTVHKPITLAEYDNHETLISQLENTITKAIID